MTETNTCSKCSKPKTQGLHGSITQWMASCACDLVEPASVQSISVRLCNACGKRIEEGRSGSFTQWIFRSDQCKCEMPEPMVVLVPGRLRSNISSLASSTIDYSQDDSQEELQVDGKTFPVERYHALREIGQGAAGQVFLCRDKLLGTKVAVKCLRHVSPEQLIQFQQEARATDKLNHPNIVKVMNFGVSDAGAPYMVMEFIEGISLDKCVADYGPLPMHDALLVFTQVADALSYSHSKGIFHRDIKSSNIILTDAGVDGASVRVIDFGISMIKHAHQEATIVQGRTVVGTPAYMAPDQAFGKLYDERSEIYSLGCAIFEALAGVPPFSGATALEIINKHAKEELPRIADINPTTDCSEELESIVAKCLAKDPDDRYQSMEQLRDACITAQRETSSTPLAGETSTSSSSLSELNDKHQRVGAVSGIGSNTTKVLVALSAVLAIGMMVVAATWFSTLNSNVPAAPKARLAGNFVGEPIKKDEARDSIKGMIRKGARDYALNWLWSGCTDSQLEVFDNTTVAETVDLTEMNISDAGLKHFSTSPLRRLNLRGTRVKSLSDVPGRETLKFIDLRDTAIGDSALANLRDFKDLRDIILSGCNVTADGLRQLSTVPISSLRLQGCPKISASEIENLREEFPQWRINEMRSKIDETSDEVLKLQAAGQDQKGFEVWKKWNDFSKTHPDPKKLLAVTSLSGMARCADTMNRHDLAKKCLDQAMEIGADDYTGKVITYEHLFLHYSDTNDLDSAIDAGFKYIDFFRKEYGNMPMDMSFRLGVALVTKRRYEEALPLLEQSVTLRRGLIEKLTTSENPTFRDNARGENFTLVSTIYRIAQCQTALKRYDESLRTNDSALKIVRDPSQVKTTGDRIVAKRLLSNVLAQRIATLKGMKRVDEIESVRKELNGLKSLR